MAGFGKFHMVNVWKTRRTAANPKEVYCEVCVSQMATELRGIEVLVVANHNPLFVSHPGSQALATIY